MDSFLSLDREAQARRDNPYEASQLNMEKLKADPLWKRILLCMGIISTVMCAGLLYYSLELRSQLMVQSSQTAVVNLRQLGRINELSAQNHELRVQFGLPVSNEPNVEHINFP
jgi:hypothetical protein